MAEPPPPLQLDYRSRGTRPLPYGMAATCLACGVVSQLVVCVPQVSVPVSGTALMTGWVARRWADRGVAGGRTLAVAGIICGTLSAALWIVVGLAVLVQALLAYHF